MGFLSFLFPWGVILQALALVHFMRRRPDTIWLWIIIFLGPVGALVYMAMEVAPDAAMLRQSLDAFGRRTRIRQLEAVVLENPSPGNYEELADLCLDDKRFARAKDCYDKAISPRSGGIDPLYRRGIAELHLGDFTAAARDFEAVTARDAKYDFNRAVGLLAHAYANLGRPERAEAMFTQAMEHSTLSETYLNYAAFLASQGRTAEARQWAERVLARKQTMPRYLQRRERPWFRKAKGVLRSLPARTGGPFQAEPRSGLPVRDAEDRSMDLAAAQRLRPAK